jgi:hypothetical protein
MLAMPVLFAIFTHWVAFVLGVALTLRLLVFNNPRRNTSTAENELQSRMYVLSADRHGQTASPRNVHSHRATKEPPDKVLMSLWLQ